MSLIRYDKSYSSFWKRFVFGIDTRDIFMLYFCCVLIFFSFYSETSFFESLLKLHFQISLTSKFTSQLVYNPYISSGDTPFSTGILNK